LGEKIRTLEVSGHYLIKALFRSFENVRADGWRDASVINQDIKTPPTFLNLLEECAVGNWARHIALKVFDLRAVLAQAFNYGNAILSGAATGNDEAAAFRRQSFSYA
jgi:hypothetical protein